MEPIWRTWYLLHVADCRRYLAEAYTHTDAPLIKEQGVQKDSQVYGAFLKAIEGGMQVGPGPSPGRLGRRSPSPGARCFAR
jgi:hypothetical protein